MQKRNDSTVGTWNMQTMLEAGNLKLLLRKMNANNINMLEPCEVRWDKEYKEYFTYTVDGDTYAIIYCGNDKSQNGVAVRTGPKGRSFIETFPHYE